MGDQRHHPLHHRAAIGIGEGDDQSLCGCGVDTPNWNGQYPTISNPRASANHQYFTTTPFSQETLGAFGTSNRRFFHGPGLNNWDMSLHKMTQITEKTNLEIRAEFFNIFNHAQFGNPSGSITSSTFGLVTGAKRPTHRTSSNEVLFLTRFVFVASGGAGASACTSGF